MIQILLSLLLWSIVYGIDEANALPVGLTLSPLGGTFQVFNHDPVSTYVFTDLFKHCNDFYIRSTNDGAVSNFGYKGNSVVSWLSNGYPASLPYINSRTFYLAMCDIGPGGGFIRPGMYNVSWIGKGKVGFDSLQVTIVNNKTSSNWMTIEIPESKIATMTNGLSVRLLQSSSDNPVTRISIVPVELHNAFIKGEAVFHPDFLHLFQSVDSVRFTQWSKLVRGQSKNWLKRTLPSSQNQHRVDGVAIEHMIDLISELKHIDSVWFSFPLNSVDYNTNMLTMLFTALLTDHRINSPLSSTHRKFKVYIESGSFESHGDYDRKVESLLLFDLAQRVYQNVTTTLTSTTTTTISSSNVTSPIIDIIPSVSLHLELWNWDAVTFSKVKAIGINGQFGRSSTLNDHYNSWGFWDLTYATYSLPQIIQEIRNSVLVADHMINKVRQQLLSKVDTSNMPDGSSRDQNLFELVGITGGPYFSSFTTYRTALYTMNTCAAKNQFPCQYTFAQVYAANQSMYDAMLPTLKHNATLEQKVEDLLIEAMRSPDMYDIYLDFLRRWEAIGGGLIHSNNLLRQPNRCEIGGNNCGYEGVFENPITMSQCASGLATTAATDIEKHPQIVPCQKYWSLIHYKQGVRSKLPYTSADVPQTEYSCTPNCLWGSCYQSKCHCFAGYSGEDCSIIIKTPYKWNDCNNDTGINLAGIADWSNEVPFVDVFLSSRSWISQNFFTETWASNTKQHLRADGYPAYLLPNQRLSTLMIRDLHSHIKAGNYVVLYDGDGVIAFRMDVVTVKRSIGRIEIYVKPTSAMNNGILLMIERSNPLDPIRNIRVLLPGYEDKYQQFPFNPLFLDKIKVFQTIRFMDWMNTNNVELTGHWSNRTILNVNTRGFSSSVEINGQPTPSTTFMSGGFGVSIEYMVHLVNLLGANPWFNMPHTATDDYVKNFAIQVKASIRPDVKIYIEYSNEVWGTLYPGGKYAQQMGMALGLGGSGSNGDTARFCYLLLRSNQMFHIWKDVFDNSEYPNRSGTVDKDSARLEFVINSQAVNSDVSRQILACSSILASKPDYASLQLIHTAIAIAPYFGSYSSAKDTNLEIFMNTTLPKQIDTVAIYAKGHASVAKANGLKLFTYESGQSLTGSGRADDLLYLQANRHPLMAPLYQKYYNVLRNNGVSLMMSFKSIATPSSRYCWGVFESSDQDPKTAFKYRGLVAYIEEHSQCSTFQQYISSSSYLGIVLTNNNSTATSQEAFSCQEDCSNSGLCVAQDQCECYYGNAGTFCDNAFYVEHVDYCGYKCSFDQGKCVPDYIISGTDRYWKCECKPNYYGVQCGLFDCPNHCNYNGKCLDANICHCFPGYLGNACEFDCGCNGHGSCTDEAITQYLNNNNKNMKGRNDSSVDFPAPTCLCDIGYQWSREMRRCMRLKAATSPIRDGPLTETASGIVKTNIIPDRSSLSCSKSCVFGTCMTIVATATNVAVEQCECWAGYTGAFCTISSSNNHMNRDSIIGANLAAVNYYSTELPFVDAFKMSSDWVSMWKEGWTIQNAYAWGNGQPIHLRDEDGYPAYLEPGQMLVKLMLRDVHKHSVIPSKEKADNDERGSTRYVCLFDGEGEIEFGFDAKITAIGKNRIEFSFKPTEVVNCIDSYCNDNGILLRLLATNPMNPVRNIRVLMPGYEHTYEQQLFYPPFLQTIRHYSVLRFKDWQKVDSSSQQHWHHDRSTPFYHSQATERGVALEYMIELCNRVASHPWFTIPFNATDDYVYNFARMVKHKLRPDLKVYVELSNEVWNTLFKQGKDSQQIGLSQHLSKDKYIAGYRYYAQRSSEIFHIWETVFNETSNWERQPFIRNDGQNWKPMKVTLVKVLSTFTSFSSVTKEMLQWLKHINGTFPNVLGGTGYWDCGGLGDGANVAKTATMSVNEIHQSCLDALPTALSGILQHQEIATSYGLKLQTYEAGQGLVEYKVMVGGGRETPGLVSLFHKANRDSGMTQVYLAYINAFLSKSIVSFDTPLMIFDSCRAFTKFGSWGHMEYTGQWIETAPKYMALRQYFYYNDPLQVLLRFPQGFRDATKYLSSSTTPTSAVTPTSTSSASNTVVMPTRFRYINRFLSKIKKPGVIPYEIDASCLICIPSSTVTCPQWIPWNSDYSYIGYPYVTSPRRGDTLSFGKSFSLKYTITWSVPADLEGIVMKSIGPSAMVTVRLWKNAYCGLNGAYSKQYGGRLVYDFSKTTVAFSSGRFQVSIPLSAFSLSSLNQIFDDTETYFFEIRCNVNYHSYFSDLFTINRVMEMPLIAVSGTWKNDNCSEVASQSNAWSMVTSSAGTPASRIELDNCIVTNNEHYQSTLSTVSSSWSVNLVSPNQKCLTEYESTTATNGLTSLRNLKLSSCLTQTALPVTATDTYESTATSCRLLRTQVYGKSIMDCVVGVSPYPSLTISQTPSLPSAASSTIITNESPKALSDLKEYQDTIGWYPLSFYSQEQCQPFQYQVEQKLLSTCLSVSSINPSEPIVDEICPKSALWLSLFMRNCSSSDIDIPKLPLTSIVKGNEQRQQSRYLRAENF